MAGELLDPYLDWVPVKRDYARTLFSEDSRRTRARWSICYRLYDRVTRILDAGIPLYRLRMSPSWGPLT